MRLGNKFFAPVQRTSIEFTSETVDGDIKVAGGCCGVEDAPSHWNRGFGPVSVAVAVKHYGSAFGSGDVSFEFLESGSNVGPQGRRDGQVLTGNG